MKKFLSKIWTVPLALLAVCILAYGLLIPFLHFYWDDLPYIWAFHQFGPAGYPAFVASDRPFSAWVFVLATSLFGLKPIGYQILILLIRWLGAAGLWWVVRTTWPKFERQAAYVALLFAVYPGFTQQPIAIIYSLVLGVLTLFILSLAGNLTALRHRRWFWPLTAVSLVFSAAHFSAEYFFALEFLRPVLLWIVLGEQAVDWRNRLKRTLIHWSPYLAVYIAFLIWRVFIFKFPTYQPTLINQGSASLVSALLLLLSRVPVDMARAGLAAWLLPFTNWSSYGTQIIAAAAALLVFGSAVTGFYLQNFSRDQVPGGPPSPRAWVKKAIPVALFALLIAGIPAWITNLPVDLTFPFNRLALAFMIGSCLLIVGLLELIPPKVAALKIGVVSLLVGSAIGWHFYNSNTYRKDWQALQPFFWQLTWRAPGLKPGTSLVTNPVPLLYYSDNSLTAPLNWTYAPAYTSPSMPYAFLFLNVRLGGKLPDLRPGLPIQFQYRSTSFDSTTDQSVVVYYEPPRCLRVIDPSLEGKDRLLPKDIQDAMVISHPSQILVDASPTAAPPAAIFDREPAHTWCYYFEKADLARQKGDWALVAHLGDIAFKLSDKPADTSERLVFVEGYARAGQWSRAEQVSQDAYAHGRGVGPMLCDTWQRIAQNTPATPDQQKTLAAINRAYQCQITTSNP